MLLQEDVEHSKRGSEENCFNEGFVINILNYEIVWHFFNHAIWINCSLVFAELA